MLIALDEPSLQVRLASVFAAAGYAVEVIPQDQTLEDSIRRRSFDLVVLGSETRGGAQIIEQCRSVRELLPGSGIVLIAHGNVESGDGDQRADGLDAGADDYITANIESRECFARITAVLRRTRVPEPAQRPVKKDDLELDRERRYLRRNGQPIHLTRREFDLLSLMMQKPGTPVSHVQLLQSVWGPDYGGELEYLRAYVRLLRKKIDVDASKPSFIRTVTGVGYCFQGSIDS